MTPLPPQERLAIYRKVLEEVPVQTGSGLCAILDFFTPIYFCAFIQSSLFPEYKAARQIYQRQHTDHWFPLSDSASRIAIVEGWIKQVEEELTNQPQG